MKNKLFLVILFALFIIPIILYAKILVEYKELKDELRYESAMKKSKIEQLEKEVRLLEQDLYILENGFERGLKYETE